MYITALGNVSLEKGVVQLIYCSRISRKNFPHTASQTIEQIQDHSLYSNILHNITGVLLTDTQFFAQILEGQSSKVNQLYENILQDERHHSVTLLQQTATNVRLFHRWPMGLVEVDDMSYVGRLSVQSTPEDLRKVCLSILKSLRPVFCGE